MSRLALTATAVVLQFGLSATHAASLPRVQFDVSRTVACQVIPDESRQKTQPGEKLIQARISVSLLAFRGEAEDVDECLYRMASERMASGQVVGSTGSAQSGTVQVVDYLPRTTMDSRVEGNIRVRRNDEKSSQLTVKVNGGLEIVQANGGGSRTEATREALEYELIPPQAMVAAVGTTGRGTGVYFKLRRTPQMSLEGSREFLLTIRVPLTWRGGYFRVSCQAIQRTNRETHVVGAGTFVVPLFLAGDSQSQRLAERLSDSEQRLYATATKNQREVQRRSLPTIAHELSWVSPKIPRGWLQQVLDHNSPANGALAFEARLPTELRTSIEQYRVARQGLVQLRSSELRMPASRLVAAGRPTTVPEMTEAQAHAGQDAWRTRSE